MQTTFKFYIYLNLETLTLTWSYWSCFGSSNKCNDQLYVHRGYRDKIFMFLGWINHGWSLNLLNSKTLNFLFPSLSVMVSLWLIQNVQTMQVLFSFPFHLPACLCYWKKWFGDFVVVFLFLLLFFKILKRTVWWVEW